MKELCIRCWDLGYYFPRHFPDETIPPKLHMLICHIPEIAMKFGTVGLLSEHGLESLHASINSISRVYASVRDKETNMKLVLGCHQQRGVTSKKGLDVQPEKARSCRKSSFCKGMPLPNLKGKRFTCAKSVRTLYIPIQTKL